VQLVISVLFMQPTMIGWNRKDMVRNRDNNEIVKQFLYLTIICICMHVNPV
jgi:hypothetical protein